MPDNGAQKHSRSYLLAVEDQEFLLRDEMRPFRFGMEYAKAEYALRDWGVRSTIVVFGSARTPSAEEAAALAKKARGAAEKRAAQKALIVPAFMRMRAPSPALSPCAAVPWPHRARRGIMSLQPAAGRVSWKRPIAARQNAARLPSASTSPCRMNRRPIPGPRRR